MSAVKLRIVAVPNALLGWLGEHSQGQFASELKHEIRGWKRPLPDNIFQGLPGILLSSRVYSM